MRVSEVMSARPVVVSSASRRAEVRRLMTAAEVHHIPVVDDGRVSGLWLATREGPLVLLGPQHVDQTFPDADAAEAMIALVDDSEAVLVWDAGVPAGILTPTDLRGLVREALRHDIGQRQAPPVVAAVRGPAGAGKTTLLARTLAMLPELEIGVVQANAATENPLAEMLGAQVAEATRAHWRSDLARASRRLTGTQLILLEDRDGPAEPDGGEDLSIAVLDARVVATGPPDLGGVSAVAICRADEGDPDAVAAAGARIRAARPGVPVFVLAPGRDDRDLRRWAEWLAGQVRVRAAAA